MRSALYAAGLVLIVLAAFGATLGHEFLHYDDVTYILENPNLREGPTPSAIAQAFRKPYFANWIPLTLISYQIDFALYGLEPAGYHATNLVLHALGTLLLFLALTRLTGAPTPAAFAAAVFAVHPLHVQSVAWVAERKDVLTGVFFAATLLAYARYVERPGLGRYLAVLAAFIAGLLSKPMLVTLPCVLLLLDFWPLQRLGWRAVVEKLPLVPFSAAASAAAIYAQTVHGTMTVDEMLPLDIRLANAALAIVAYLRDAVWPANLAIFYPHPLAEVSPSAAAIAAALLLATSAGLWLLRRRRPSLLVGWLWFTGMLVPVLGLIQVGLQARADRYTYLALTGLALALAWEVDQSARNPVARRVAAAAGIAVVLLLTGGANFQARYWQDTETLFRHATLVTRDNWLAHKAMGDALFRRGELEGAVREYTAAARANPRWAAPHRSLADVHADRGDWQDAILAYERSLRFAPRDALGHLRLARALAAAGQNSEALGRARYALQMARGGRREAEAQVVLGFVHAERGELDHAIAAYDAALEIQPSMAQTHAARGVALLRSARTEAARRSFARGLALAREQGDEDLIKTIRSALAAARLQ